MIVSTEGDFEKRLSVREAAAATELEPGKQAALERGRQRDALTLGESSGKTSPARFRLPQWNTLRYSLKNSESRISSYRKERFLFLSVSRF